MIHFLPPGLENGCLINNDVKTCRQLTTIIEAINIYLLLVIFIFLIQNFYKIMKHCYQRQR